MVDKIIKIENPEKLHEKIGSINLIFEFIEKTISNYQDSVSRAASNSRMIKILKITS